VTLDWGSLLDAEERSETKTGSSLEEPGATEAMYADTYPAGFIYWRAQTLDGSDNPTSGSTAESEHVSTFNPRTSRYRNVS
jgi:hypothetical protein